MYLKIVKETSETRKSLDEYDVQYFLNLYEGLTLNDYLESLYKTDVVIKQNEFEAQRELSKRFGSKA